MVEKKNRSDAGSAALVGSGAVVGTTGLVAGGLPGAKSDFSPVANMKRPDGKSPRKIARALRENRKLPKAAPGGIFGFRTSAHRGGLYGFDQKTKAAGPFLPNDANEAYKVGRTRGKLKPEKQIIRHMKGGRAAANTAMLGGAGIVAHGVDRERRDAIGKSSRREDTYNGALAGAGATGAAVSHGGSKVLASQGRKWEAKASNSVDRAGKIVPSIGGRQGKQMSMRQMDKYKQRTGQSGKRFDQTKWPKTMYPKVSDNEIKDNPGLLKNVKPRHAERAGELRGAAAQQRHFAEVYRGTSKAVRSLRTPSAIVGAAGVGGLAASKERDNKVKKSSTESAFGVDHGV